MAKRKRKTRKCALEVAFSLRELSTRLGIPTTELRRQVAKGRLMCDQQGPGRMQSWDPDISRDAAVEFCVVHGMDAMRCM